MLVVPVNDGLAIFAFKFNALSVYVLSALRPILFEIVVAKLGSLPYAFANSFNVFNVAGLESTNCDILSST